MHVDSASYEGIVRFTLGITIVVALVVLVLGWCQCYSTEKEQPKYFMIEVKCVVLCGVVIYLR